MKKSVLTIMTLCAMIPASLASAASNCYTPVEAEAEQGIRIHSELMVIGLNCQRNYRANGENLYAAYRKFTAANGKLFAEYETKLISFFEATGSRNAEGDLNNLRTAFANKISLDAAKMRPDMFCYRYAPRIEKVQKMNDAALRNWARTSYSSHPTTTPLCKE